MRRVWQLCFYESFQMVMCQFLRVFVLQTSAPWWGSSRTKIARIECNWLRCTNFAVGSANWKRPKKKRTNIDRWSEEVNISCLLKFSAAGNPASFSHPRSWWRLARKRMVSHTQTSKWRMGCWTWQIQQRRMVCWNPKRRTLLVALSRLETKETKTFLYKHDAQT